MEHPADAGSGLHLHLVRTPHGVRFIATQLGADWARCPRTPHEILRTLDEAWHEYEARTAARAAVRHLDRHYRAAPGSARGSHNPADWRRLDAGQELIRSRTTHRHIPCPDGAWQSPAGNVYWPDSATVPQNVRSLYDPGYAETFQPGTLVAAADPSDPRPGAAAVGRSRRAGHPHARPGGTA